MSDSSLVHNICQAIYFPTEPVSLGQLASMNGLLFYIFKEYLVTQDPICKQHDLKKYLAACERNFTLSIETYEILAVPSFENVLALVLAVSKEPRDGGTLDSILTIVLGDQMPKRMQT